MKNDSPAAALAAYRRMTRACVRNRLAWDGIRRRLDLVRSQIVLPPNEEEELTADEIIDSELFICAAFAARKAAAASVPAPRARPHHSFN